MMTYIGHNIDDSEELRAKLEVVEGELAITHKQTDEGVGLLRKAEEGKETTEAKAH